MKRSKRYKNNKQKTEGSHGLEEAVEVLRSLEKAGFDETVEVHYKLNIDPTKTQQQIRFSTELPKGTGKIPKIAVFAEGEKAKEAKEAGADKVLGEKEIQKIIEKGKVDFEIALATPDMMPKIAKAAKILGPKGLMPSPKTETVTPNIKEAIELLKKGKVNVKSDSGGVVHQAIGKVSFKKEDLVENYKHLLKTLEKQKPEKLKGRLIKTATISTTMSPGIKLKIR